MTSSLLLSQLVLLPGIPTTPVPPPKKAEERASPASEDGALAHHGMFDFMEGLCEIEIGRDLNGMLECIPSAPQNLKMVEGSYVIASINAFADLSIIPLDNTPEVKLGNEWFAQKTSLAEAFATMRKCCAEKKFMALDLHSFGAWITHDQTRYASLLAELKARYCRSVGAFKVIILFADPIKLGQCEEEHCVILEVAEDFSKGELRIVDAERRLHSLHNRETVIGLFVRRKWVVTDSCAEKEWLARGKGTSFKPASRTRTGKAEACSRGLPDPGENPPDALPAESCVETSTQLTLSADSPWAEIVRENNRRRRVKS